jgi:hypothetical protein
MAGLYPHIGRSRLSVFVFTGAGGVAVGSRQLSLELG